GQTKADNNNNNNKNKNNKMERDKVQIFSNSHQEWYTAEIIDILKDEEGEWLNVVWHRDNGEAMSKQVQRYSTDVRPVQVIFIYTTYVYINLKNVQILLSSFSNTFVTNNGISFAYAYGTAKESESKKQVEEKKVNSKSLEDEIKQRRQGYKRRAPPFARTCTGVLWQYPATQSFRRAKKLDNVEEAEDEVYFQIINFHYFDSFFFFFLRVFDNDDNPSGMEKWNAEQVSTWLKNAGSAYEKYIPKFRSVRGSKLKQMTEDDFCGIGLPKLHAVKLSLEIQKLIDKSIAKVNTLFVVMTYTHTQCIYKKNIY
ncbi:hypothetical protein RFI_06683, partial [Reticulomyxa filosa]